MLEHPSFEALTRDTGARTMHFDQCKTRPDQDPSDVPEKKTALYYSKDLQPHVHREFAHLMCDHAPGTHASMLGVDTDGVSRASKWENYSADMNGRLSRCLVRSPLPPLAAWAAFYAMRTVIAP